MQLVCYLSWEIFHIVYWDRVIHQCEIQDGPRDGGGCLGWAELCKIAVMSLVGVQSCELSSSLILTMMYTDMHKIGEDG